MATSSLAACSGGAAGIGPGAAEEGGLSDGGATGAPSYEVHLRATQAPVAFTDGLPGETPLEQHIGLRKLTLYRAADDPSPVVVFDNGTSAVECGLDDGNDTVVGRALAATLPAGRFTVAHVTVGYYRFKVAATLHASGQAIAGDYADIEVLTDGTTVDGVVRNQGHFSYTFEAGGNAVGTLTGEDLIVPVDHSAGGLALVTTGRQVDYVFPVDLTLDPALAQTVRVVMTVNTYQNFRWQDRKGDGFAPGVFDTTATTYETVMSYGANAFTIGVE